MQLIAGKWRVAHDRANFIASPTHYRDRDSKRKTLTEHFSGLPNTWILRARDRDRDILARLRFGHQQPLNRRCPDKLGHQRPVNRGCPQVSKPVSQDIQSICYCLHTGIFRLDTCDLLVAGVRISISPKYLYLYLALKVLTQILG